MMKYVALLRGINVGKAKLVPMAELAETFVACGFTGVRTLLRSGNVVFESDDALTDDTESSLEATLLASTGVLSNVLLLDRARFIAIAEANPLLSSAHEGSKVFVTFHGSQPSAIEVPDDATLLPEVLRLGDGAVYQWFPKGSMETKVPASFWKQFAAPVTARNANTVAKLVAMLD